jgi:hypothetical protein
MRRTIFFPDKNFESVIRETLKKPEGGLCKRDLKSITKIEASSRNISNIHGIQYMVNLQTLNLERNQISDISPLFTSSKLFRFKRMEKESKVYYGTMSYVESTSPLRISYNCIPDWQVEEYRSVLDAHFHEFFYFGYQDLSCDSQTTQSHQ